MIKFNTNKQLYHYTKFETASKIIASNQLKYGSLKNMNDLLESHRQVGVRYNNANTFEDLDAFSIELNKYHQISLTQDSIDENRGFAINPMWAHYADNKYGVCLVFDKDTLLENAITEWHNPVNYRENYDSAIISNDDSQKYISQNKDSLFFQKEADWSYEREYRIVKRCETDDEINIKGSYLELGNSLIGVIMCEAPDVLAGNSVYGSSQYKAIRKLTGIPIYEYGPALLSSGFLLRDENGECIYGGLRNLIGSIDI